MVTYQDHLLLRFGTERAFAVREAMGIEVVMVHEGDESAFGRNLANDVRDVVSAFTARSCRRPARLSSGVPCVHAGRLDGVVTSIRTQEIALDPNDARASCLANAAEVARVSYDGKRGGWRRRGHRDVHHVVDRCIGSRPQVARVPREATTPPHAEAGTRTKTNGARTAARSHGQRSLRHDAQADPAMRPRVGHDRQGPPERAWHAERPATCPCDR